MSHFRTVRRPSLFRIDWERILREAIEREVHVGKHSPLSLGVIGALGTGDVGDEAMLCAMIRTITGWWPDVKITIFSSRPRVTSDYLGLDAVPSLSRVLNNRRKISSWILHLCHSAEKLLTGLLRHILPLDETICNGWVFRGAYLLLLRYVLWLAERINRGRELAGNGLVRNHLRHIQSLDALLLLGGGYLNSWHVKHELYPYLITAKAALAMGKPVFASGLNLGPFNVFDERRVVETLDKFKLIGIRDSEESRTILQKALGEDDPRVYFSSDDAIALDASPGEAKSLEQFVSRIKPYIAIHAHTWRLRSRDCDVLKDFVYRLVDRVREAFGVNILLIPMTFGKEVDRDRILLTDIRVRCRGTENVYLPPADLRPGQIKFLFSEAELALGTRYHALIFSVSEGVPFIAISFDRYYDMKFAGMGKEYGDLYERVQFDGVRVETIMKLMSRFVGNLSAEQT